MSSDPASNLFPDDKLNDELNEAGKDDMQALIHSRYDHTIAEAQKNDDTTPVD